jgi:hypothetical protein
VTVTVTVTRQSEIGRRNEDCNNRLPRAQLEEESSQVFRGGSRSCTHGFSFLIVRQGLWSVGCETGDDGPYAIDFHGFQDSTTAAVGLIWAGVVGTEYHCTRD